MGVIDRAILQDEIRQALNALFANGQVGRTEAQAVLYEKHAPDGSMDGVTGWTEETGGYTTDFTIGKKYVVCLDSGTYETECRQVTEDGFNVYLGNGKLLNMTGIEGDYPDTGESFVVVIEMGVDRIAILDTNGGQSVVIKTLETIHPIDQKFLPGVCLPVLKLSQETMAGIFASGNASCTAEEHAIIWGAYQALYPLIIKGNYTGIAFSGVSNILLDEYFNPYFMADAGKMKVQVNFDDKTANIRSVQQ